MLNHLPALPPTLFDLWQKFTEAPATFGESEGVRANWHKGRKSYAVWVARVHEPAVVQRAEEIGIALAPWLLPQPLDDLHVTLGIAGFPAVNCRFDDDVDEASIQFAASKLRRLNMPLRFRVFGACSFLSAPFLAVSGDNNRFEQIRSIVDLPGRALTMHNYVPHVTIGRWNGEHPTAVLTGILGRFSNFPGIVVKAKAVELVEFETDDPFAKLVTRIVIALPAD